MLDRVDDFLSNHELRVRLPKELTNPELLAYVPSFLLKNLPEEVRVPLSEESVEGSKYRTARAASIKDIFSYLFLEFWYIIW